MRWTGRRDVKIDLNGRTAVVTGSTEGIGFAVAGGLAGCGATVLVTGRSQDKVDAALQKIVTEIPEAKLRGGVADFGTAEGCAAFLASVPAADILINNVGIFEQKSFFDVPDADWARFFEVNVMSGVRLSRAYLGGMTERGWGRIVFVSSESAINIPADMLHYGVTKTAMLGLSRGLAKLAQGSGVTVNAVLPGPTLTEGVERMLQSQAKNEGKTIDEVGRHFVRTKRPSSLIQRLASPQEVASMVVYVCSAQASATTGAALRVDGGVVESIL
jgi:NAD(P)-dependent dehydrogenase (short-subunit alcohol dehydrogenase family)